MLNQDYKEMLSILLKNDVKFLTVGAYALGSHGFPRATGDIDIWVKADKENSEKIYRSLIEFGAPKDHFQKDTFANEGNILQLGVRPRRIDISTYIDGVSFDEAWTDRLIVELGNLQIPIISKDNLIKNKLATGRAKDIEDVKNLKNIPD